MHGLTGRIAGIGRVGWGRRALLVVLLAVLAFPAAAQYDVAPALDRLLVSSGAKSLSPSGLMSSVRKAIPGAQPAAMKSGETALISFPAASSSKALEDYAQKLAGEGFKVYGLARTDSTSSSDLIFITDQIVVRVAPNVPIVRITSAHGLRVAGPIAAIEGAYVLQCKHGAFLEAREKAAKIAKEPGVLYAYAATPHVPRTHFVPNDPIFPDQWHLNNVGQAPSHIPGYDVNAVDAWDVATGLGVNITVVDSGVQMDHPDLVDNIIASQGYDYWGYPALPVELAPDDPFRDEGYLYEPIEDGDPTPATEAGEDHGTSVAGVAAAVGNNGIGVTGAAFNANILPVRIGLGSLTRVTPPNVDDYARAMLHWVAADAPPWQTGRYPDAPPPPEIEPPAEPIITDINTNSWGGTNYVYWPEDSLMADALEVGVTEGRDGKGIVYLFSAGNQRYEQGESGFDFRTRSRYTISVAATDARGMYSWYSTPGPANLVSTPSAYAIDEGAVFVQDWGITTTTIGGYTDDFSGTSSACPLAAGVVGLILEANPELTWRDVQHILVETSWQNDPTNPTWQQNGAGHWFSPDYGYGTADAYAAVTAAASWNNVGPYSMLEGIVSEGLPMAVPDNDAAGIVSTATVNTPTSFATEHVEVVLHSQLFRDNLNDLRVTLISPSGTESVVCDPPAWFRQFSVGETGPDPLFMSVAFWGEDPTGTWQLHVADTKEGFDAALDNWELRIYGTGAASGEGWGVDPLGGADLSGPEQGPYTPESFTYTLQNDGEAFAYSVVISEPWLSLDSGNLTGTVPATDSLVFDFAVNAEAGNLPQGVYRASITFTNEDTGETARRFVTLEITEASATRPQITGALITPVQALTGDELNLVYEYFDPNGDAEAGKQIEWMLEGEAFAGGSGTTVLSPAHTRSGDVWSAMIRVQDESGEWSRWVQAAPVQVKNSLPVLDQIGNKLFQQPAAGAPEDYVLSFTVSATDPDNDPALNRPDAAKQKDSLDPLVYGVKIVGDPANAAIDPQTGEFTWDTTDAHAGTYSATFTVEDAAGAKDSEAVSITIAAPCPLPAAPSGVSATDGTYADYVEVTWDAVEDAAAYRVYRTAAADGVQPLLLGTETGTVFRDYSAAAKALPNGLECPSNPSGSSTYYYWVAALDDCGEGDLGGPDSGYAGSAPIIAAGDGLLLAGLIAGLLTAGRRYRKQRKA